MILIYLLGGIAVLGTIIGFFIYSMNPKEKWQIVYFSIVNDHHFGLHPDITVNTLQNRYGLTESQAHAAIEACIEHEDQEWFKENIK